MAGIAAGFQAIGSIVGAAGALQEGDAKAKAARYNAQIAQRNAQVSLDQANLDAATQQRQAQKVIGGIVAGYGASGVTGEGSPADVIASSAANAEMDRQTILYKGRLKAMGYQEEATLDLYAGEQAKTQSYYQAGSKLLNGASSILAGS